ncbi:MULTISPECIES: inorganic pyrophosphatase [Myxococcus]|uniref:inorganic pyrophosphatase n=1 Tax=Myxococcus TaxID=32 RepID=UPI001129C189|nr:MULTISPECIES: inorganic pyrophosphatase [Myxococcus]QDE85144.1 inorganic pyrophosphatase [Myxococcus xanthus]QDE99304.1 inorganic pyrophosphatase [Myxococcus xanthus]QDF07005.1 inorganic pyrophosphatase [Myxococcus xanthus]WAM24617.1 inorganic pyrophosphatase [Myxococcus sp. NMCA1]
MKKPIQTTSQAHPWHGITPGEDAPEIVTAYIEIVPTDAVKYELDKESGILKLDRPQRFSSQCPTLYGFIPQTYCDELVAKRCAERTGLKDIKGDGDPIDICVLTEKVISSGNLLVRAIPIGGFRMVDGDEADDKIIAVLESDLVYGELQHLAQLPRALLDRLKHYFLTYKQIPGEGKRSVEIAEVYDQPEALEVIKRSMKDYERIYGPQVTTTARSGRARGAAVEAKIAKPAKAKTKAARKSRAS